MRFSLVLGLAITIATAALLGTATVGYAATQPTSDAAALSPVRMVYSDEFDGPLDTGMWANLTPWSTRYTTNEQQYYDPANVTISSGSMHLTSEARSVGGYPYASGIVTSLARPKFSYGYFEMRAKLPKGQGVWPAFWLTNDQTLEIDIMEMLGDRPNRIYGTMHRHAAGLKDFQRIKDGADYSAGFHTFAVDWQPTHVKWYVDDVLYATYTGDVPSDPMWICLNTAVGGKWSGVPDSSTKFPQSFDIDYVRVYDRNPVAAIPAKTAPVARPVAPAGAKTAAAKDAAAKVAAATVPGTPAGPAAPSAPKSPPASSATAAAQAATAAATEVLAPRTPERRRGRIRTLIRTPRVESSREGVQTAVANVGSVRHSPLLHSAGLYALAETTDR